MPSLPRWRAASVHPRHHRTQMGRLARCSAHWDVNCIERVPRASWREWWKKSWTAYLSWTANPEEISGCCSWGSPARAVRCGKNGWKFARAHLLKPLSALLTHVFIMCPGCVCFFVLVFESWMFYQGFQSYAQISVKKVPSMPVRGVSSQSKLWLFCPPK